MKINLTNTYQRTVRHNKGTILRCSVILTSELSSMTHHMRVNHANIATATCRFCSNPLRQTFADLGSSPLCQRHIEPEHWNEMEPFYPLHAYVCERCFLVQLDEYVTPATIFSDDYAYFSSFSTSWLEHAKRYTDDMTKRFGLTS